MPVAIPFVRDFEPRHGRMVEVAPGLRRVVAPNPSAFTFHGTGTYVIGRGKVAVVDPGPLIESHLAAILEGIDGETVTHILVTHTHLDHSPLAAALKAATGAATYGFGPHGAGTHEAGERVEEGGDAEFAPDHVVRHGDAIEGAGWRVEAVHTPGHTSNHLCFRLGGSGDLLTGDHVMGWSTSVISPPDGDMADYMASLALLLARDDAVYWPTHGGPIREPKPFVRAFVEHRREREAAIAACLAAGIGRVADMVPRIYADTIPARLYPAAGRSVLAHLLHMHQEGRATTDGAPGMGAVWRLAR
jgi:glyoxylase-like metal-dependent hydrolase (beta-lactamase superfamily II)